MLPLPSIICDSWAPATWLTIVNRIGSPNSAENPSETSSIVPFERVRPSLFPPIFRFDLIFDTVGPKHYSFELMSPLLNRGGTFVTIVTPLFPSVDKYGLVGGLARSAYKATRKTLYVSDNKSIRKTKVSCDVGFSHARACRTEQTIAGLFIEQMVKFFIKSNY